MIDALVKVGGSLASHPEKLRSLCRLLGEASKRYRLVLSPGGGPLADAVRRLNGAFRLKAETSHWMAVLAVDQYGLMLSSLIPGAKAVSSLKEAERRALARRPTVFLPYRLLRRENPLPASWEAASDTIAAYLAQKLRAGKLLLLKDVDGIFRPPFKPGGKPLEKVSLKLLKTWRGETCLDPLLPQLLDRYKIPCLVVNGLRPDRVRKALKGEAVVSTLIEV